MEFVRVPHPFAFFAKGWDSTNAACLVNSPKTML
jgi:hypothetical protein